MLRNPRGKIKHCRKDNFSTSIFLNKFECFLTIIIGLYTEAKWRKKLTNELGLKFGLCYLHTKLYPKLLIKFIWLRTNNWKIILFAINYKIYSLGGLRGVCIYFTSISKLFCHKSLLQAFKTYLQSVDKVTPNPG